MWFSQTVAKDGDEALKGADRLEEAKV